MDLILLGFLAKFSVTKNLDFVLSDFYLVGGLLLLWAFYNFVLEAKHDYAYRGKTSLYLPAIAIVLAIVVSAYQNVSSLVPLFASVLLVLVYVQKNKNALLGNISTVTRGLIQSSYFLYAVLLFSNSIGRSQIIISVLVFFLYNVRALVGDMRDIKHNMAASKRTFPVTFGMLPCKSLVVTLLAVVVVIQVLNFGSYLISLPLALFAISLVFSENGYVLHQLFISTTSFFHINFIGFFTNQNLIFTNIIFLGILLNFVFYPLLKRESNPVFVQD